MVEKKNCSLAVGVLVVGVQTRLSGQKHTQRLDAERDRWGGWETKVKDFQWYYHEVY